jgi:uncharacterized membrane protein
MGADRHLDDDYRALGALLMFIAASLFGIALVLLAKMFI